MRADRGSERSHADQVFERLYEQHRAEVYRFVLGNVGNREEAEDVTQIAFANAYRALTNGEPPEQPRPWLFAIARNAAYRGFRRRRFAEVPLDEERELVDDLKTSASEIREALERLSPNQRAVLLLREIGGLSYAEIGRQLDLSVPTVQMLLFRARRSWRTDDEGFVQWRASALVVPVPQWLSNALNSLLSSGGSLTPVARGASLLAVAVVGMTVATGSPADPRGIADPAPPVASASSDTRLSHAWGAAVALAARGSESVTARDSPGRPPPRAGRARGAADGAAPRTVAEPTAAAAPATPTPAATSEAIATSAPASETQPQGEVSAVEAVVDAVATAVPGLPPIDVPELPPVDVPQLPPVDVPQLPPVDVPQLPPVDVPAVPVPTVPDLPAVPAVPVPAVPPAPTLP